MGLKKGMTNNPNGRKKGVPNKSTQAVKEVLEPIIMNNFQTLEDDLSKLKKKSLKDYFEAISKLLPYIAAKKSEIKGEVDTHTVVTVKREKQNGDSADTSRAS